MIFSCYFCLNWIFLLLKKIEKAWKWSKWYSKLSPLKILSPLAKSIQRMAKLFHIKIDLKLINNEPKVCLLQPIRIALKFAIWAAVLAFVNSELEVLSIEPRDRNPLRCRLNRVDGVFEFRYRFADVVVHDGQIEKVSVSLTQHVRFFRQTF